MTSREALEAVAAGRVTRGVYPVSRAPVDDFKLDDAPADNPLSSLFRDLERLGYLRDATSPAASIENGSVMSYGWEAVWLSERGERLLKDLKAAH